MDLNNNATTAMIEHDRICTPMEKVMPDYSTDLPVNKVAFKIKFMLLNRIQHSRYFNAHIISCGPVH